MKLAQQSSKPLPAFMLSNVFAKLRGYRLGRFGSWRYVVALVLSVLLHFVLIAGASWHFPVSDTDDDTIEVALVPQRVVEKPAVKPVAVKPKASDNKLSKPSPQLEAAPENKVADQVAVITGADTTTKQ